MCDEHQDKYDVARRELIEERAEKNVRPAIVNHPACHPDQKMTGSFFSLCGNDVALKCPNVPKIPLRPPSTNTASPLYLPFPQF